MVLAEEQNLEIPSRPARMLKTAAAIKVISDPSPPPHRPPMCKEPLSSLCTHIIACDFDADASRSFGDLGNTHFASAAAISAWKSPSTQRHFRL
jgi:hypothetical protein